MLNRIEQEVIYLKAVTESIDSMVNHEVMSVVGIAPDSLVSFRSTTHQRLFNLLLVDFLSCVDRKAPVSHNSYLGALRDICENPNFGSVDSITKLKHVVDQFADWLNEEVEVENVALAPIEGGCSIRLPRIVFLKTCGNIAKHNFLRNISTADELANALKATHPNPTVEIGMLALANFYERFHFDFFAYHSSTIAEFLNNIRWAIHEYLRPEYKRSLAYQPNDDVRYMFTYPNGVDSEFARQCYWDLMNEVRRGPFMQRFQVTPLLKRRY